MKLSIARADCSVQVGTHRVFVDLTGWLLELISQEIDQVLHQVSLGHQQVLPDVCAVALELELFKQYIQQLLVRLLVCLLHPLLQLVYLQVVLLGLKRRL